MIEGARSRGREGEPEIGEGDRLRGKVEALELSAI
jgi:hypothetical protein